MIRRATSLASALMFGALAALVPAVTVAAIPAPAWQLTVSSQPTNFVSGSNGDDAYLLVATNVGDATTNEAITITDTLPEGLTPIGPTTATDDPASVQPVCTAVAQTVTCTTAGPIHPSHSLWVEIPVDVELPAGSTRDNQAEISGGKAPTTQAFTITSISSSPASFGFLAGRDGFEVPFIGSGGSGVSQAGSHPDQINVQLGFPTDKPGGLLTGAGHVRDVTVDLPRGLLADPAATPTRCTEAELVSQDLPGCPDSSQVGTVNVLTRAGVVRPQTSPLYNMVPPPGAPASFAFDAAGIGIFIHLVASVRSDGDYGASGTSSDILALGLNPILSARAELWGDPSSSSHDYARGACLFGSTGPCPVDEAQTTAFLALSGDCPGHPSTFKARADSWEEPGIEHETSYESADLAGNPVSLEGCGELEFKPTIEARPTTSLTDSPSGLDVDLHQPQDFQLGDLSTANLKDATITLPAGVTVNPAQASGLGACTSEQVGLLTPIGQTPIHFSKQPASCPAASKVGTVEVTSPLLAKYNEENEVIRDSKGNAIPEPLHGSVYIAKPFDNPFDSLLAIYISINDPRTGIVAKLAGRVEPDPATGQLRTRFEENPELPIEDVRVHLFTGPGAPLITPPLCGTYTTTADLVPWSGLESTDAHPTDTFAITAVPGGDACPESEGQMPNAPAFTAGTVSPRAGAYSPLVFKLGREDGSQRLAKIDTTLPPGLLAKLAGVSPCTDAEIAAAQARSHPNEGTLEQADPSCPAASEVGVVSVSAGAGPTPFNAQGHAYLAGPYNGAPLSLVVITPAVAGPFDLGAVVVRTALYLDPNTAQARAVSDPLPTILDGIPLDVRSVVVRADRPQFSLNPTSCDPMAFSGVATSTLGQIAPLAERFQVGGCSALPFKPKLEGRLFGPTHRGGHPRFRAVLTAKPGEANIARTVLSLPRSEFIDQAHFRTICTRVQFAADQCPAGSVYGYAKATSPLVDYTLEGPVYLRSSTNPLPDIVIALRGPPGQPIAVDAVGRVDSVNGGIRTTFDAIPDAPLSKVIVTMQGAKQGLFQNSTNICKGIHRATVKMDGQNGKDHDFSPMLKASCPKTHKR